FKHTSSLIHPSISVLRLLIALLAESNFSEQTDRKKTLKWYDVHDSEDPSKQSTADMTAFVSSCFNIFFYLRVNRNLLDIFDGSLDDMGGRINELEQSRWE
ncbi:unnamed protein product, partial [Brassica oleracea]